MNTPRIAPLPTRSVRRVAFLGTPELAAEVLTSLIAEGFEIAIVVTRADKKRGRGSDLVPSPVKVIAEHHGLQVVHDVDGLLVEHHRRPIDLGIVVAFGAIIKPHVLAEIPLVNLHVSMLPRWRGAAPIERAILAGDDSTGVCVMQVDEGLDTGGIVSSAVMNIDASDSATTIGRKLMREGTRLLVAAMRSGDFSVTPQVGEPTYAAKIDAHERKLDWSESAEMVSRRVRIGDAWTTFRSRRIKIHAVEPTSQVLPPARLLVDGDDVLVGCADRAVRLVEIQPEGRGRLQAAQWVRGARLAEGDSMDRD